MDLECTPEMEHELRERLGPTRRRGYKCGKCSAQSLVPIFHPTRRPCLAPFMILHTERIMWGTLEQRNHPKEIDGLSSLIQEGTSSTYGNINTQQEEGQSAK